MHLESRKSVEALAWFSLLIVVTYGDVLVRTVGLSKIASAEFVKSNHAIGNLQKVKSITRCVALCIQEAKCLSVYYKDQGGECMLYNAVAGDDNGGGNQTQGWRYYGLDTSILETKMAVRLVLHKSV